MLSRPCLLQVIRDFRLQTICESAVSARLEEMVLADLGPAWLTGDISGQQLTDQRLISAVRGRGEIEFDSVFYCRDEGLVKPVGEVIATMERRS